MPNSVNTEVFAQEIKSVFDSKGTQVTKNEIKQILDKSKNNKFENFQNVCVGHNFNDDSICTECEKIVILDTKQSRIDSLLTHIRNAIAHGRIGIYEETMYMIDIDDKAKAETAKMLLKISTLIKWISIIEKFEKV